MRGFGLKVGVVSKGRFAGRIRELVTGQAMLERVIEPMLRTREALRAEYHALHRAMLGIVREDTTCRRLMTVPEVGAVVAIMLRAREALRAEYHRASLRSVFTTIADSAAFTCRVSSNTTSSPAFVRPACSHCDSGPASTQAALQRSAQPSRSRPVACRSDRGWQSP